MLRHRFRYRYLALSSAVFGLLPMVFWVAPTTIAQTTADPDAKPLINEASSTFNAVNFPGQGLSKIPFQSLTNQVVTQIAPGLIDPFGRITGCAGEPLAQYNGFTVALYDPADAAGTQIGQLTDLTRTEVPDIPGNGISRGLLPNADNVNPFFMSDGEGGKYNFLFDPNKGQLDSGRAYILVVNPPRNSIFSQRRVRIIINQRIGNIVSYTATALDGKPIAADNGSPTIGGVIQIGNAEATGLVLSALTLSTDVCQAQELQIVKAGDRATAEPGDTVIYRLSVRNLSDTSLRDVTITDNLPLGFRYRPGSARAELRGNNVPVSAIQNGSTVTFTFQGVDLPPAQVGQEVVLNLAYATTLTPDAMRGTGQNLASAVGLRTDNGRTVRDGPATHQLRIRRGITADCGTIIGRVFDDKNFDGEQQEGEPGIPNAVVFLEDGNRITTDEYGMFSVANVLPGYRTGVLDMSSIPGYTLNKDPNFKERHSQSRLVQLAPNGLVRMNFAVTPIKREVATNEAS